MASRFTPDDDEFDWDAAVREIDVACEDATLNSNKAELSKGFLENTPKINVIFPTAGARQSTLDKFIGRAKKSHLSNEFVNCEGVENIDPDDSFHSKIDLEAAKTWIYPVNIPCRDYQFNIARKALFSNTLVALPTGLGKTLIAAVVMYNYFRWFPEGKIVFAAPSRPLVLQQIEACHNIVGIPQEWTIDMTGQMTPAKRANFWKVKRVFFVTPQVLEKDIQSGTCLVRQLVCLVIDEAHRAMGNYAYCVIVRELMAIPVELRILALTATPGSKQGTVQNVIDNLNISTLEYRNEDDHDVSPYVHNRKLEIIEVPLGNDAVEVNNMFLEAIRPIVARLCACGVLPKRDITTLSPCDLLNSRDKFRQAPPLSYLDIRPGEIEGCFGVLITLYHIRKLLLSHGMAPAYEMLEEKLQQGSLARLMSRNEIMWKAKLLMQQSISHGTPTPKLLKMIEVLRDHFKTKDPKSSRVIIFSNFRGSVKDIMVSLESIGEQVKATQFIGQSSGKSSKGQSQKMQQEVLQKFRSGGYNVIVATSIGEEGLDIMEVDLVICFDANISPLRMIQRMGRTGRKHDGRVVVLACEGSELKGYLRKQAHSKAVSKHMRNGGTNSFEFRPSPRMVPHICKPEAQFVELSIEQFVPRGKKVKDEAPSTSTLMIRISDAEVELLSKYFGNSIEDTWRPSLIAFPHFQAFPSSVHKVKHSARTTGMLIDTMEQLRELSSYKADDTLLLEVNDPLNSARVSSKVKVSSAQFLEAISAAAGDNCKYDASPDSLQAFSPCKMPNLEEPSAPTSSAKDEPSEADVRKRETPCHSFLFGVDFVCVGPVGEVLISSVPVLPFVKEPRNFNGISSNERILNPCFPNSSIYQERPVHTVEEIVIQTPISKGKSTNIEDNSVVSPVDMEMEQNMRVESETRGDLGDAELSPRLTNLIKKGVVPESPIVQSHRYSPKLFNSQGNNGSLDKLHCVPDISNRKCSPSSKLLNLDKNGQVKVGGNAHKIISRMVDLSGSPVIKENHTPSVNQTCNSSREDWHLSSGEASKSFMQQKFKRLRRYGDKGKRLPCKTLNEEFDRMQSNLCSSSHARGNQRAKFGIKDFIEEEAEVSDDAYVSEDEVDNKDEDQYDGSFIDDRIDPTAASTQAETREVDMMAIYRRSLLTQSPIVCLPNHSTNSSNDSQSPRTTECGSCSSKKTNNSLLTPSRTSCLANQSTGRNSVSCQVDMKKVCAIGMQGETSRVAGEDERKKESRKRKLSFHQVDPGHSPICQEGGWIQSGRGEAARQYETENTGLNTDGFFDDQFYNGLDLDAVEEQATKFLRSKLSVAKRDEEMLNPAMEIVEELEHISLCSPSFDLGI